MANIFVDANVFIDLAEGGRRVFVDHILSHYAYISPLSLHILCYTHKYRIPHDKLLALTDHFTVVDIDPTVVEKAMRGPTGDFEDNLQLQSAAAAGCNYFVTLDKKLLKMGVFGTMEIVSKVADYDDSDEDGV